MFKIGLFLLCSYKDRGKFTTNKCNNFLLSETIIIFANPRENYLAMNKSQLIDTIAQRTGISKIDAKKSIDAFIDVASETLRTGEKIVISGFGSFEVTKRPARTGRNFLTGTPVEIPPKSVVKFRSSVLDGYEGCD
jgi:DNA-binding protein HU-beta